MSHPVGFRLPDEAFAVYEGIALEDSGQYGRRKVGDLLKIALIDVQKIIRVCQRLGITPEDVLNHASRNAPEIARALESGEANQD